MRNKLKTVRCLVGCAAVGPTDSGFGHLRYSDIVDVRTSFLNGS